MDKLAKKLIKRLFKYSTISGGPLGEVELKVRDIIFPSEKSPMLPGIHYVGKAIQNDGSSIEFSAGIFCPPSHKDKDKYRNAWNVGSEVYSFFLKKNIPVKLTWNNF